MRTQKDGRKQEVPCPLGVLKYTKRMGGDDRVDQKRGTYPIALRSRRWWMTLFYFAPQDETILFCVRRVYFILWWVQQLRMHTFCMLKKCVTQYLLRSFVQFSEATWLALLRETKKRISNLPSLYAKDQKLIAGRRQSMVFQIIYGFQTLNPTSPVR